MRWIGLWMVLAVSVACSADDASDAGGGSGSAGGESSAADPCDPLPILGDACATEAECNYADDCGSVVYGCVDGSWAQTDEAGCGVDAIACADNPSAGDPCNFDEVCDPDGDCLDVLECDAYNWAAFDVCTEVVCAEAQPLAPGDPCEGAPTQFCNGAPPCDGISYRCLEGQWSPYGGGAPQGCE